MKQKRRDKGSGCIRQRKDKRWEGRVSIGGHRSIYVYGKTKQEVRNKLFAEQREPSRLRGPEATTVGDWLDKWLDLVRLSRRHKTYELYKSAVENHIKPHLDAVKLDRLSKSQLYEMFDGLKNDGVGDAMLEKVYKTLHRALQVAFKRDRIARNVAALVDKPVVARQERIILRTEDEVGRFQQAVKGSQYEALYLTALDTGLRQGELLALKWENVDLGRGMINVSATLTENEKHEMVAATPKTASSIRAVKLAQHTIDMLRDHRKRQMDPKRTPSVWVFSNWDGGPMRKDGYVRRELPRLLRAANLPRITFHGLRHSHATLLAALGVPIKATQERLGHSTSRMTLEVYSHATAAIQEQAVSALDAFHQRSSPRPTISGQISGQSETKEDAEVN